MSFGTRNRAKRVILRAGTASTDPRCHNARTNAPATTPRATITPPVPTPATEPRILRRLSAAPFEVVLVGVDVLLACEPLLLGVVVVPVRVPVLVPVPLVPEPDVVVVVPPETLPVYEIVEVSSENVVVA